MFVVSLTGFRPIPRDDDVAWTQARVEESASRSGPWTALQTFNLSPVDTDPTHPLSRNFTVSNATLEMGWYRAVFLDPSDGQSSTEPVFNSPAGSLPPTPGEIRARSPLIRTRYPAEPFDADRETDLANAVRDATGLVESLTGRTIDETLPETDAETDARDLHGLAVRAVTLKTERLLAGGEARRRRSTAGGLPLRSFTAGPYSESYFGPEDAQKAKQLDPDPLLAEVLWALATQAKRDEWLFLWSGQQTPAAAVATFGWNRQGF